MGTAGWSTGKRIATATAVAGLLDIAAAAILTVSRGKPVEAMLRGVASGPFPDAPKWGSAGAATGLAVHFAIMGVMAAVYVLAADRIPALKRQPLLWGVLYGLATYAVMNLLVLPLRFGAPLPPPALAVATQLFCHIVLVGIPIAWVARR